VLWMCCCEQMYIVRITCAMACNGDLVCLLIYFSLLVYLCEVLGKGHRYAGCGILPAWVVVCLLHVAPKFLGQSIHVSVCANSKHFVFSSVLTAATREQ